MRLPSALHDIHRKATALLLEGKIITQSATRCFREKCTICTIADGRIFESLGSA